MLPIKYVKECNQNPSSLYGPKLINNIAADDKSDFPLSSY